MLDIHELAQEYTNLKEKIKSGDFDHADQKRNIAFQNLERDLGISLYEAARNELIFIPESEWENHCKDIAIDNNCVNIHNPLYHHIDWKSWSEEISQDYDTVKFDGNTYYYSF